MQRMFRHQLLVSSDRLLAALVITLYSVYEQRHDNGQIGMLTRLQTL